MQTASYSRITFPYNRLRKEAVSVDFKTSCAKLLRYGKNGSVFQGDRTKLLSDKAMT